MEYTTTPTKLSRLLIISAVLGLAISLSGCENAEAIDVAETPEEPLIAIPVETHQIRKGEIASTYQTTAILEAKEEAFVVARASGIIEQILVEEGDYVEKGQVLAQLDKERYELGLAKARADLRGIEQELAKMDKVYSKKLISDDAYEKLTAQFQSAAASVRLAELDLKEATIRAPISGFIAERNAKVGNLTESFQRERMFHIVQQRELQGIVYLPESQLLQIRKDQPAQLIVAALGNSKMPAYVERISPVIDASTGTFKVTLRVPNAGQALKAGMFSEVSLQYATKANATLLPRKALVSIDDQQSVFVVSDGVANKVPVTTGFEQGDMIEVVTGLTGTESVVITGHQNLKDASPVDVVNG
ncbi:efflux RND transporter periplasmic adaptor subunit [Alteromonas sp. ASW11-19]|uniref:Efflux RND transporter periplasmic adaptor subunit n=1 Tax=Alteromonas salexigens TaxID=2982530 RepID=A0ABT2VL16_9ALTE|nr:efflux RND transporter periplasmic adaptor subunit [Alteromonas salexigens]MCU7553990.1 efflux RND transporter periplasmic adaptor subunit [Alteromonas salexigens]